MKGQFPSSAVNQIVPGTKLDEFTILCELGRGGMGAVFRAASPEGRHVALKLLLDSGAEAEMRFIREAELLARVDNHPNIVRIHKICRVGSHLALALEFVQGKDLARVAQMRLFRLDDVLEWCAQVADALAAVHRFGLIHRDIKPSNVLIRDEDNRAVLTDFGVARALDVESLTRSGTFVGTPHYFAPEQLDTDLGEIGAGSDIWALGVVIYELVAGEQPFKGASLTEVMSAILARRLDLSHPGVLACPADLRVVLDRCLAFRPKDRYQDAAHLAADLRSIRRGQTPNWALADSRRRRRKGLTALISLILVTSLVFALRSAQIASVERDLRSRLAANLRVLEDDSTFQQFLCSEVQAAAPEPWRRKRSVSRSAELQGLSESVIELTSKMRPETFSTVAASPTWRRFQIFSSLQIAKSADSRLGEAISSPNPSNVASLREGIQNLKRRDFESAISIFKILQADGLCRLSAQIGLVLAFAAQDQFDLAGALLEELQTLEPWPSSSEDWRSLSDAFREEETIRRLATETGEDLRRSWLKLVDDVRGAQGPDHRVHPEDWSRWNERASAWLSRLADLEFAKAYFQFAELAFSETFPGLVLPALSAEQHARLLIEARIRSDWRAEVFHRWMSRTQPCDALGVELSAICLARGLASLVNRDRVESYRDFKLLWNLQRANLYIDCRQAFDQYSKFGFFEAAMRARSDDDALFFFANFSLGGLDLSDPVAQVKLWSESLDRLTRRESSDRPLTTLLVVTLGDRLMKLLAFLKADFYQENKSNEAAQSIARAFESFKEAGIDVTKLCREDLARIRKHPHPNLYEFIMHSSVLSLREGARVSEAETTLSEARKLLFERLERIGQGNPLGDSVLDQPTSDYTVMSHLKLLEEMLIRIQLNRRDTEAAWREAKNYESYLARNRVGLLPEMKMSHCLLALAIAATDPNADSALFLNEGREILEKNESNVPASQRREFESYVKFFEARNRAGTERE